MIEGEITYRQDKTYTIVQGGIGFDVVIPGGELTIGRCYRIFLVWRTSPETTTGYGFLTREDRNLFNRLLSTSGIGTKIATQLMTLASASSIVERIGRFDFIFFANLNIRQLSPTRMLAIIFGLQKWYGSNSSASRLNISVINSLVKMGYSLPSIYHALTVLFQAHKTKPTSQNLLKILNELAID